MIREDHVTWVASPTHSGDLIIDYITLGFLSDMGWENRIDPIISNPPYLLLCERDIRINNKQAASLIHLLLCEWFVRFYIM